MPEVMGLLANRVLDQGQLSIPWLAGYLLEKVLARVYRDRDTIQVA